MAPTKQLMCRINVADKHLQQYFIPSAIN